MRSERRAERGEDVTVTVELLGLARVLARRERVTLLLAPAACAAAHPRLRDVARALVVAYPALVGAVLTPDGALGPGTLFSLDGRAVTDDLSQPVPAVGDGEAGEESGATVLLLTSMEGGA